MYGTIGLPSINTIDWMPHTQTLCSVNISRIPIKPEDTDRATWHNAMVTIQQGAAHPPLLDEIYVGINFDCPMTVLQSMNQMNRNLYFQLIARHGIDAKEVHTELVKLRKCWLRWLEKQKPNPLAC